MSVSAEVSFPGKRVASANTPELTFVERGTPADADALECPAPDVKDKDRNECSIGELERLASEVNVLGDEIELASQAVQFGSLERAALLRGKCWYIGSAPISR